MATLKDDADTKTILAEAGLISLIPSATSATPVASAEPVLVSARPSAAPAPNNGLQVRVAMGGERK